MSIDMQALPAEKAALEAELAKVSEQAHTELLDGVSQQRWWLFKNQTEIVYDSHYGYLIPNFDVIKLEMLTLEDVGQKDNSFVLSYDKIHAGIKKVVKNLYPKIGEVPRSEWELPERDYFSSLPDGLIYDYATRKTERWYLLSDEKTIIQPSSNTIQQIPNEISLFGGFAGGPDYFSVLLVCQQFSNKNLHPKVKNLTPHEKASLVLEFFQQQNWQPIFDNARCQEIYLLECNRPQLEARLQEINTLTIQHTLPIQVTTLSSTFNYQNWLKDYQLADIDKSLWQFSRSAQQWHRQLLNTLDDWSKEKQSILVFAQRINTLLAEKMPPAKNLTPDELTGLQTRRHSLQQQLNFSLAPLRAILLNFQQQAINLEKALKALSIQPDAMVRLAKLAQEPRPTFESLAEHTALLCLDALKQLEWLEANQTVVSELVTQEKQWTDQFVIFIEKYQQDLLSQANDNSINTEEVTQWFNEWRRERWLLEQRLLPLIQLGLDNQLSSQTILAVMASLITYREQLDRFYHGERLSIHTKFAFVPNGHRQEKLEKELELNKLASRWLQQLQAHIFEMTSSGEKLVLVRWADVWLQDNSEQILQFLQQEQVIERGEISQIVLNEIRQLQQRTLENCLQDAQQYSEALKKRDADYHSLVFRMRKELQAGK